MNAFCTGAAYCSSKSIARHVRLGGDIHNLLMNSYILKGLEVSLRYSATAVTAFPT